jgi:ribosomal protein S18 acetylase RimI-like enzyme
MAKISGPFDPGASSAALYARVEDFRPADTDALVRMWRASFEYGVGIVDPHPLEEQIEYLRTRVVPLHRVRVAKEGDSIVGFLASNRESIAQLHVRVQDIGRGIGTLLLRLAQAESSGGLWLFTFARNVRACRFYEHHGFVAVARGFEPMWKLDDVKYQWIRPVNAH